MSSSYQQGKNDVKEGAQDLKYHAENKAEQFKEKAQDVKRDVEKSDTVQRAEGAKDQLKEESHGLWEKTKEVVGDVKESIVEGASTAYEKTKEFFVGENKEKEGGLTEKEHKDLRDQTLKK